MIMERYARQIALDEIGVLGQTKITNARVLIVGVGGLGSPISLYLTAAGVGNLGLVDDDCVSLNNLQRQILYTEDEVGQAKAECACRRLKKLNREVNISVYNTRISEENAQRIISGYDIVVDATDNYATRYLLDDVCRKLEKTLVYGAICGFSGQVSVFVPGGCSYRDLYPDETQMLQLKADRRVIGVTPAVVAGVQAGEVLKLILGAGESLINRLWTVDLLTMQTHTIDLCD